MLKIFITLLFFLCDVLSFTYTGQQTLKNIFKQIEHLVSWSQLVSRNILTDEKGDLGVTA